VSAFAGVLLTFRLATAVQDNGIGLELSVVAIVLLGGVSIFGGRGTIAGVILAVFVFAGFQNALFLTNFDQRGIGVVTGGLLVVSVLVPNAGRFAARLRELAERRRRLRALAGQG
jgi:rhamnose transport system permease protein